MFRFVKQIFVSAMMFFGCSLSSVNPLECVSINNNNEPIFYPFSIRTSKCNGSCNNINDSYANLRVPNVFKNLNVKVCKVM